MVLHVSPYFPPHVGGLENHVRLLTGALARSGLEVRVLTSSIGEGPSAPPDGDPPGVSVRRLPSFGLGDDAISPSLLGECTSEARATDLVHLHGHLFYSTTVGALVRRMGGPPTVLTFHGEFQKCSRLGRLSKRARDAVQGPFILRAMDQVIALTGHDSGLLAALGVDPDRITVIPNGIPLDRYRPDGKEAEEGLRRRLGLEPDAGFFLFVGRLVEQKGVRFLLEAARLVLRDHPSARFVIAGEGPLRARSVQSCAEMGIGGSVTFAGWLPHDDLIAAYCSSTAVLAPSLWEGMPLVVLEAAACGRPVIASDIPGITMLVEDGRTGLLVPPRRPDELARAVSSLIDRPEDVGRLSRNALDKAKREFDISRQVEMTIGVYERSLGDV